MVLKAFRPFSPIIEKTASFYAPYKEYGIIEFNSAVEGMYINGEGSGDPATVNAVYYQIDGRKIIFKNSALVGSWTIMEKSKNRIVLQAYLPQEYKVILTKKY